MLAIPSLPPPVPLPVDGGSSARQYLESHGLVPIEPPIRASDYDACLSNPFQYYLTRRLGLVPALWWSEALNTGTWFHKRAELFFETLPNGTLPPDLSVQLDTLLSDRLSELRAICHTFSISPDKEADILERERRAYSLARALFESACTFRFPSGATLLSRFQGSGFRPSVIEGPLTHTHEKYGPIVVRPDLIIAEPSGDRCWIIDWKTCSGPPTDRLSTCTVEQSTYLYPFVLQKFLETNELPHLKRGATVGGMIHIAFQKPSIRLSGEDRDFTIKDFTPSTGKNKGITRQEKGYFGEPRYPNYLTRVRDWLHGTGLYSHERPLREAAPPVNISTVRTSTLSPYRWEKFDRRLALCHKYATCPPLPVNFPENISHLLAYDASSPYTPFYLLPPAQWPEAVVANRMIVARREEQPEEPHGPQ